MAHIYTKTFSALSLPPEVTIVCISDHLLLLFSFLFLNNISMVRVPRFFFHKTKYSPSASASESLLHLLRSADNLWKTNGCLSRHVSSDLHTHSVQFADGLSIVFGPSLTLGMHAHAMGHDQLCNIESETNRWSKIKQFETY